MRVGRGSYNIQYQPFLSKRFPRSKWYWVEMASPSLEGGLALGVLSITNDNREVIKNWMEYLKPKPTMDPTADPIYWRIAANF